MIGLSRTEELPPILQIDDDPTLSHRQKIMAKVLCLRGDWGESDCPCAEDHIPLLPVPLYGELHLGWPMTEGTHGLKPEPEEYSMELQAIVGWASDSDDVEETVQKEDSEESKIEVVDGNEQLQAKKHKFQNKGYEDCEWVTTLCKKHTCKEVISLLGSFFGNLYPTSPGKAEQPHQLHVIIPTHSFRCHLLGIPHSTFYLHLCSNIISSHWRQKCLISIVWFCSCKSHFVYSSDILLNHI